MGGRRAHPGGGGGKSRGKGQSVNAPAGKKHTCAHTHTIDTREWKWKVDLAVRQLQV